MFVGKAKSMPQSGTPERWFTWVSSSLTGKHQTRLERLSRDKHSSSLQMLKRYSCKSFIILGPGVHVMNIFFFVTDASEY
jgi:hypothetical protein